MYKSKSGYSLIKFLNQTTNKLYKAFETKESWYRILSVIVPKLRYEKLSYVKKKQVSIDPKKNIDDVIEYLAKDKMISKREVRLYIEEYGVNIDAVKRSLRS